MPGTLRFRWVGHLAIFVALVLLLTASKSALVHVFLSRWSDGAQYLADKILRFAVYLIASAIMARLESKSIAAYGLPVTRTLVPRFIRGAVISFLGLTAFLLLSRAAGLFHFGSVVTHGVEAWKWCAIYVFAFLVVAVEEEFQYRGYLLYALARGIGFWPAAVVSSVVFAYGHLQNPGETWLGILNLFLRVSCSAFCSGGAATSGFRLDSTLPGTGHRHISTESLTAAERSRAISSAAVSPGQSGCQGEWSAPKAVRS